MSDETPFELEVGEEGVVVEEGVVEVEPLVAAVRGCG